MMIMIMMGDRYCVNRLKVGDKRVLIIKHASSGIRRCVIGWGVSQVSRDCSAFHLTGSSTLTRLQHRSIYISILQATHDNVLTYSLFNNFAIEFTKSSTKSLVCELLEVIKINYFSALLN
jgi:hypothetical protein